MQITSLRTFEDWKTCIEVSCRIALTSVFVEERIRVLGDDTNERTQRFVETWGEPHRARVLAWFEKARIELAGVRA